MIYRTLPIAVKFGVERIEITSLTVWAKGWSDIVYSCVCPATPTHYRLNKRLSSKCWSERILRSPKLYSICKPFFSPLPSKWQSALERSMSKSDNMIALVTISEEHDLSVRTQLLPWLSLQQLKAARDHPAFIKIYIYIYNVG